MTSSMRDDSTALEEDLSGVSVKSNIEPFLDRVGLPWASFEGEQERRSSETLPLFREETNKL